MDRNLPGEGSSTYPGGSSSSNPSQVPVPLERLHQSGPPPFLTKTYDIVENQSTNHIISWSSGNNSFVIWDPQTFSMTLLPRFFKHNNFSSFVRQLNTYGFRKVDPDRWEFANEGFLRGQRHLLNNIRRRRSTSGTSQTQFNLSQQSVDSCVEVGLFGSLDKEIDRLKRDKKMLMLELVKIRQQQQSNKSYLETMEDRLRGTEIKQQQLMGFLAKAIRNPTFMQQLIKERELRKNNLLLEAANKRRRHIDQGPSQMVIKTEPSEDHHQYINFQNPHQMPNPDHMMLGMNMQPGFSTPDEKMPITIGDEQEASLDQVFWEEFLNDKSGEDLSFLGAEGDQDDDDDDDENIFDQFGDPGS